MGVDPGPYTLRELLWLAAGAWDHTAFIVASNANIWRGQDQKAILADTLNPYRKVKKRECSKEEWRTFARMEVKKLLRERGCQTTL